MKSSQVQGQSVVDSSNDLLNLLLYSDSQQPTQIQVSNNVLSQILQGQQVQSGQNQTSAIDNSNMVQSVPIGTQAKDTTLTSLQAALTGNTKQTGSKIQDSLQAGKTGSAKRQTKKDGFVVPQVGVNVQYCLHCVCDIVCFVLPLFPPMKVSELKIIPNVKVLDMVIIFKINDLIKYL